MIRLLKIEMLKLKNSSTLNIWFGMIFICIITSLQVIFGIDESGDVTELLNISLNMAGLFYYPIFIVLVVSMLIRIENANDTWKVLFSSGIDKKKIYISKYLFIVLLVLSGIFLNIMSIAIAAVIKFKMYDMFLIGMKRFIYISLASLGFISIEFFIALLFKSFLMPLTVGIMGMFVTFITSMSGEYILFNPFGYVSGLSMGVASKDEVSFIVIISIIIAINVKIVTFKCLKYKNR